MELAGVSLALTKPQWLQTPTTPGQPRACCPPQQLWQPAGQSSGWLLPDVVATSGWEGAAQGQAELTQVFLAWLGLIPLNILIEKEKASIMPALRRAPVCSAPLPDTWP